MALSVQAQILKAQLQLALAKDAGDRLTLDLAAVIHSMPPQQQEQARRIMIQAASEELAPKPQTDPLDVARRAIIQAASAEVARG